MRMKLPEWDYPGMAVSAVVAIPGALIIVLLEGAWSHNFVWGPRHPQPLSEAIWDFPVWYFVVFLILWLVPRNWEKGRIKRRR